MNDTVRNIFELFPGEKKRIEGLTAEHPELGEIFKDYGLCIKAFRYWSVSKAPEAVARTEEYRTFVQELHKELAEALTKLKP